MSRFYFSWIGNKRQETEQIHKAFNFSLLDKEIPFDIIVEPFAGSAAFSAELFIILGMKNKFPKYIINDTDCKLIELYNTVKAGGSKQFYDYCAERLSADDWDIVHKKIKDGSADVFDWFHHNKIRGNQPGMRPIGNKLSKLVRTDKNEQMDIFLKCADISSIDWLECVNKYINNESVLIFLDPPYFNSFNSSYSSHSAGNTTDEEGVINDNTKMYVDLISVFEQAKCGLIMVINGCYLLRHLYKPWIIGEYEKKYSINGNKTQHLIVAKNIIL